jgi:hypothetical protein
LSKKVDVHPALSSGIDKDSPEEAAQPAPFHVSFNMDDTALPLERAGKLESCR